MTDIYDVWDRYNKSKRYMEGKGVLTRTEKNWLMYSGKQWEACNDSEGMEDLPMMNFIKPTVKYKVSSIASTIITAMYSDLSGQVLKEKPVFDPMGGQYITPPAKEPVVSRMNKIFDISWEKSKMRNLAKKGLKHAAVQGDCYFYWGEGKDTRKPPQLIHNTQMHLGDENITDIQRQPWLIIEERLSVEVVRERARLQGIPQEDIARITADSETDRELVNKKEVKDKITSLVYMEKDPKTGIVSVGRYVKDLMYEKLHPIRQTKNGELFGRGLTRYPIVSMIWEEMPNDARGMSEVEQLIPNQLELNKMLARRAISGKQAAFPRLAYDDTAIANPEDLNKVGAAIKMNGGNTQAITSMISYLAPQSMSPDAQNLCDELLDRTRTLAGASDAQLGNIDLSRVSGTAAQTVRDQQQLPLNEQQEMYQNFIEEVALLYCDLWATFNPDGFEWDGVEIEAGEIDAIQPNVRVDICEDTSLSKMAAQQELTNLFNNGKLTFEEYVDAYPEHSSIPKDVLRNIVEKRKQRALEGMPLVDEQGNPIDNELGNSVNVGGDSGGSYQAVQSQLAQEGLVRE